MNFSQYDEHNAVLNVRLGVKGPRRPDSACQHLSVAVGNGRTAGGEVVNRLLYTPTRILAPRPHKFSGLDIRHGQALL